MNVTKLQRRMGMAQVCRKVRSVPVKGAVYPAAGPKQPSGYGPKVTTPWATWSATWPTMYKKVGKGSKAKYSLALSGLPLRPGVR